MSFDYSFNYVIHTAPISPSFHVDRPTGVSHITTLKFKFVFIGAKFEI